MAVIGKSMTSGSPWKHILFFTLPILAGSLLQQFYHTADTLIVGNFSGEKALSAVGATNTLAFMLLAVAIGFSAGNGVIIAQHYGAGRENGMRSAGSSGILFLGGLGLAAGAAAIALSRLAYKHILAVPPEILDDTVLYFQIYASGLIFQFLYNSFSAILRAVGDSAATLYFLLIASVVNILLDLLFVAVWHWGVAGAAAATNIAQALSAVAAWLYMRKKYPVFRYRFKELIWDKSIIAETFRVGFPIALQLVIVAAGLTFILRAVNSFGQVMTAAFTVGQRIEMYMHLPCNALQTALATYTGQNAGAGKLNRIKQGTLQGVMLSAGLTVIISGFAWVFASDITGWFGLSEQAAIYSTAHLQAVALTTVILSLYVPVFGVFQGVKYTIVPTVVALCALTLRVIVTYLFKDSDIFNYSIIWWNSLFGFSLGCLITYAIYWQKSWQKTVHAVES